MGAGLPSSERATKVRKLQGKDLPYTAAGLPGLLVRDMPYLKGTNAAGLMLASNVVQEEMANRGMQPNVFLNPINPKMDQATIAHEVEHLLARQNAGFTTETRDNFLRLLGAPRASIEGQKNFFSGLKQSLPYLKEKYGVEDAYMTPSFIDRNGRLGLHEILATLAGAESANNVDLTKDPELRKTMFKDRNVREAYNAVTGLRQTRLDPRDLPPYTRQEEPVEPGVLGKIKRLMGYANGGVVDAAGNKKLI